MKTLNTPPAVKKPKATKLTTCEQRAKVWCDKMQSLSECPLHVEWKRSRDYGYNPVIETHNGKATNVSGCGYDKLSTCLADFLRFLAPTDSPEYRAIWKTHGAGEYAVMDALKLAGWELKKTGSGKSWDAYTLAKLPATEATNA